MITRCDQVESVEDLRGQIARFTGDRPIFNSRMQTARVSSLKNGSDTLTPAASVAAFCAVGNPRSFFEQVRSLGYDVVLERSFHDHHIYSHDEIDSLVRAAKDAAAEALITTAKDAVKLGTISFGLPCHVLEIEIAIENDQELTRLVTQVI